MKTGARNNPLSVQTSYEGWSGDLIQNVGCRIRIGWHRSV